MRKILVIDDDSSILEIIAFYLENSGYSVTVAENGLEGQLLFEDNNYDLVITDLIMPEQEGIETIINLKRINPSKPIIAMSGGGSIGPTCCLDIAKQLGADDTLIKPFDEDELINSVVNNLCCN